MNSCKDKEICAEKCESCGEEAVLDEYSTIYIDEMENWLKEQKVRADELKFSIDSQMKIKELNEEQLRLNELKTIVGLEEYNKWREQQGLKPRLMG